MSKELTREEIEKMAQIVRENRSGCSSVKFAGRPLFRKHCGERLAKFHVFYPVGTIGPKGPLSEHQGNHHYVCVVCLHQAILDEPDY